MKTTRCFCLSFLLALTISAPVPGQGTWGVEAGVNFANVKSGDIADDTETRTGLLLAVYYQYDLEKCT